MAEDVEEEVEGGSAEKRDADAPVEKPLWNSLEVSKLGVSMLTPILIFSLGALLTYQNKAAEDALRNSNAERDDRLRVLAEKRDDRIRQEANDRDQRLRDQADKRDDRIRTEAIDRDKNLRQDAIKREDAQRAETERAVRLAALYTKRTEFWEKFRVPFAEANSIFNELQGNDENIYHNIVKCKSKIEEAEDFLDIYSPYIDGNVIRESLDNYKNQLERFEKILRDRGSIPDEIIELQKISMKVSNKIVLTVGAHIVANSTGFRGSIDRR